MSSLNGRNLTVCVCHKIQVPSKSIQNQFYIFSIFYDSTLISISIILRLLWAIKMENEPISQSIDWSFFLSIYLTIVTCLFHWFFYLWCTNILTRFFYFILSSISCLETIITFFLLCMNYIIIKIKYIFV